MENASQCQLSVWIAGMLNDVLGSGLPAPCRPVSHRGTEK